MWNEITILLTQDALLLASSPPVSVDHFTLQLVGVGLSTVFELVRSTADSHPNVCLGALRALLAVLEGLPPEALGADDSQLLGTSTRAGRNIMERWFSVPHSLS